MKQNDSSTGVAERPRLWIDPEERNHTVWDVRERLEENFRRVEELLSEMESHEDAKMRLAAAAELRQHIALAEQALRAAARVEQVREFQDAVMAALEMASATVRRKVVDILNARSDHAGVLRPPE